ncbi:hypothetical protein L3Q82_010052 [Scortum barcoo]|uniref:Uncharacterized protein n=1 Tax=Scortum barcoo TaxID=214431 RepID=A0ACB8WE95_9TELE|nr:hypothetical protein L3Q82_010052 [Scortum barcoo]
MWYGFINSCFGSTLRHAPLFFRTTGRAGGPQFPAVRALSAGLAGSGGVLAHCTSPPSLVWTVPPLLGWSSYGLEGAGTSCSVTWTERSLGSHSYIICLFVFCLGLPVLVMVYCYGRLLHAVKQVGRIRRTAARHREFHILFMVITTVVCYLLCWMPYGIVAMMATFGRPGLISPVASIVPSILAKSSTVINPVIYILMNKQFYRCFLILFHCKHQLTEPSPASLPSKTTAVRQQPGRRHSPDPPPTWREPALVTKPTLPSHRRLHPDD